MMPSSDSAAGSTDRRLGTESAADARDDSDDGGSADRRLGDTSMDARRLLADSDAFPGCPSLPKMCDQSLGRSVPTPSSSSSSASVAAETPSNESKSQLGSGRRSVPPDWRTVGSSPESSPASPDAMKRSYRVIMARSVRTLFLALLTNEYRSKSFMAGR